MRKGGGGEASIFFVNERVDLAVKERIDLGE